MPTNYVNVGGWLYEPGSAAHKRALELYRAMPQQSPAASPAASVLAPYTAPGATPTTSRLPSYGTGSPGGGGGALAGAPGMRGQGAFGLVPQVPSPIATAGSAIAGNTANLPGLSTLGTDTTRLNANLGAMPYQMNLPGYGGMLGQSSQNISSNLAGIIDPAQWNELQRKMAERGASMGLAPSSPNANTALMQALNQSIIGTQALGQNQLNAAIGRTPTGQPFNTAGQQISPTDVQAAQYQSNLFAAAPDPAMAAQANLDMLLKAIEAGRAGGLGGVGGGGGGFPMSRMTVPDMITPVNTMTVGAYSAPGYAPRYAPTSPGVSSYSGLPSFSNALNQDVRSPFGQDYGNNLFESGAPLANTVGNLTNPYNLGGYDFGYGTSSGLPPLSADEWDYLYGS